MVTPYFSKLCHCHPCLLNAPYLNCRSKNRGTKHFKLPHNDFISRGLSCSLSTIITLVLL
ncbi:unnamed protein product [Callosobruchus maculatus]|uniref:Uncharacterized protein n=1 Tax=Callosobruchus maculatus TaxID=64391 RepID=A0A653CBC9_CALMS|nr:unnamed protein product [Callosobruchus maculatus]